VFGEYADLGNCSVSGENMLIWGTAVCQEGPLEEAMATLSSILACRISWTDELGGL